MPLLTPVKLTDVLLQVPFTLLNNPDGTGAYSGDVGPESSSRTLSIKCRFEDHEKLIRLLYGLPVQVGTGAGATVTRALPVVSPWNPNLYVVGISIRAAGSDNLTNFTRPWTSVVLTIKFGTLTFDPKNSDQPYLSINIRGGGSFITHPNTQYSFSTGEKIDADVGVWVAEKTYMIRRFQLPSFDAFESLAGPLVGKVNSDTVTIKTVPGSTGTAITAGYLLFETYDLDLSLNVLGTPQFTATVPLRWRALPWNSGLDSTGTPQTITPAPYQTAALSGLLA